MKKISTSKLISMLVVSILLMSGFSSFVLADCSGSGTVDYGGSIQFRVDGTTDFSCLGSSSYRFDSVTSPPSCGTVTGINPNKYIRYTHNPSGSCACGSDTFTFRTNNPSDSTWNTQYVTVTININCTPDCTGSGTVDYGQKIYLRIDNNSPFSCLDSDYRYYQLLTGSACGNTVTDEGNIDLPGGGYHPHWYISYTATNCCDGSDSFVFSARELIDPPGHNNSYYVYKVVRADITINNCTPSNQPPKALVDSYSTNEDTPLTVPAAGVLTNDVDPESNPLTAIKVTDPSHGTVALNADGSFTYTPTANYCDSSTPDTFTYKANDGTSDSNVSTVSITVICSDDDPPVAVDDSGTTNEDTCVDVNVTTNDSDPDGQSISVQSFTQGVHGTVTDQGSGVLRYCPDPNWCGSDNYNYTVTDGALTDTAKVVITVTCINDPPVANDDYYSTDAGAELVIPAPGVLANDSDPDGDPLEVYEHQTDVTNPANGTLVINENGSFTYTPKDGFCGEDTFTYRAGDFDAVSERATVTIEVKCRKSNPLPESILYPGIDIERLNVPATGINVISDGKVVSQLQIAPGTQSILVEVENRGFLTQVDVGVRLEGLPQGVTYSNPQLQKVKAHNIATYTVTLTVSPDVPEGTYQIRAVAYSRKGPRDKIDLTLVVD